MRSSGRPQATARGSERIVRAGLRIVAFSAMGGLLLIAAFIFSEGLPFFLKVGIGDFLFSSRWEPGAKPPAFGILPMVAASLWVTIGAMIIGAPLGVAGAVFLTQFVPPRVMKVLKPTIELLAGIPSVVYGFIGVTVLVPWIRVHLGGSGLSVLAAAVILGIMVLPTILSISVDAISAVPPSYREGALALGATPWQAVHMVILKAARSGIVAGIVLGMGRAVGETMAVIMVAGNAVKLPASPLDSVRTLTANIALEMGYAIGLHRQALFATGIVLLVVIVGLNFAATRSIRRKAGSR